MSPRKSSIGFMLLVPPLQMTTSSPPASSMAAISTESSHPMTARYAVRHADLAEQRVVVADGGAHRLEHLESEAHPVRQRAAVLVLALVGARADELVDAVAVAEVDLDGVEAHDLHERRRPREDRPPAPGSAAHAERATKGMPWASPRLLMPAAGAERTACRELAVLREAPAVTELAGDCGARWRARER